MLFREKLLPINRMKKTIFTLLIITVFLLCTYELLNLHKLPKKKEMVTTLKKSPTKWEFYVKDELPHKIVHFDFKGAPLKVSYLKDIISFIKDLNGTGILLEYEDMFPYYGDIEDIKSKNAYTRSDIYEIVETAELHNLTVIPLIQTFAHLEFVLKLEKYKIYRELENNSGIICPSKEETFSILKKMVDQVMEVYPSAKYLHIGCDEVFDVIGLCPKCKEVMKKNKWRKNDIYFAHIRKIAEYITYTYQGVRPIIWADKIISKNFKLLLMHKINSLVDIMIWNYGPSENFLTDNEINGISRMFEHVWIAGAFKGAIERGQVIPDPFHYRQNIEMWLRFVSKWKYKLNFKGIVLTGWQRFEHFSVLCELFPVAIPSLAVTLQSLHKKQPLDHDKLMLNLNCNNLVPVTLHDLLDEYQISRLKCDFPGFYIFKNVLFLYNKLRLSHKSLKLDSYARVALINIIYHMFPQFFVEELQKQNYEDLLNNLTQQELETRKVLAEVYDTETIDEWIFTHVLPTHLHLQAAVNIEKASKNTKVWPRRPEAYNLSSVKNFFNQICNTNEITGCGLLGITYQDFFNNKIF